METIETKYLAPTHIIDSDHPEIIRYALTTIGESTEIREKAVRLFYAVRDDIWYDPYLPFYLPEHYRASNVLKRRRGYCVGKAVLLCALGRVCGIPSRVGFATVRNHLITKELFQMMGTDVFVYHGFTEFFLNGVWIKATPTFNIELCKKHNVPPLEFNGREDSVLHAFNLESKKFMQYLAFHGSYADVPVDIIVAAWEEAYGRDRVRRWIAEHEKQSGSNRNFYEEAVLKT